MPRFQGIPVDQGGAKRPRFAGVSVQPAGPAIVDLPAVEADQPDPTKGMSGWQLNKAGLGQSIVNTGYGLRDAATDAARYFVEENPVLFDESTAEGLRKRVASQRREADERAALNAPLNATAAGKTGNIVGTVAQVFSPGLTLKMASKVPQLASAAPRLNALAAPFLPTTIRGGAAQGAAFGALQPVGEGESRGQNALTSGALSAAGGVVLNALVKGGRAAISALPKVRAASQERAAAEVLNKFANDPAALRAGATAPQMIVPGSRPTLAEASGDVGLAGLQRTLANAPEFGNRLAELRVANNAARVGAIEGAFGGADDAAAAAVRAGRDASARQILKPIDKLPMSSLDKVVTGVQRLSEKHQAAPNVQAAMDAVKTVLPNIRTVRDAHDVRQYIGQLMSGQVEGKAGAKLAQSQLMTVRALLDREMRAAYPEWGRFLREYKAAAREADQIDTGAELLATGRAVRTGTNQPDLTPAAFGRAAGNLDRTVARATGFPKARADRTLTPQQVKVVDEVRRDLERYSRAQTEGKAIGSNTMQNIVGGNRLQDQVGPVGAAMIEPVSGIALLGLNQMRKAYGQRVAGIVEEAMLDPARAAEILAKLPPAQRRAVVRQAAELIPRIGMSAGVVAPAAE